MNKLKFTFLFLLLFFLIILIIYYYYFSSPNKEKVLLINQVRFASLDYWSQDDHLKAFQTFKISCKKLVEQSPNKNMGALTQKNNKVYPFGGQVKDWIKPCKEALQKNLNNNKEAMLYFQKWFLPFSISYSHPGNFFSKGDDLGLFTGYYEPVIEGNNIFTKEYKFPIYSYPNNYLTIDLGKFKNSLKGNLITGQIKNKKFIPAHKRSEINKGALLSSSEAIYWLKDDVESFFLHIQGSGVIKLPNGEEKRVKYDGSNGYDYFAIGRELIEKGHILKNEISMQKIKLWLENNPDKKDQVFEQLDLFRKLKAPCLVYGETAGTIQNIKNAPLNTRRRLDENQIKVYAKKMTLFAEWCSEKGMPISFHHHMGTAIETEQDVDLLMTHSGEALKLLYDAGHMAFSGGGIISVIEKYSKRISHVHAKDIRLSVINKLDRDKESFLDAVLKGAFTVPGDGSLDFKTIILKLADHGYEGWFVVEAEQDPKIAPPLEYALKGFNTLVKALVDAGYEIVERR